MLLNILDSGNLTDTVPSTHATTTEIAVMHYRRTEQLWPLLFAVLFGVVEGLAIRKTHPPEGKQTRHADLPIVTHFYRRDKTASQLQSISQTLLDLLNSANTTETELRHDFALPPPDYLHMLLKGSAGGNQSATKEPHMVHAWPRLTEYVNAKDWTGVKGEVKEYIHRKINHEREPEPEQSAP